LKKALADGGLQKASEERSQAMKALAP